MIAVLADGGLLILAGLALLVWARRDDRGLRERLAKFEREEM